MSQAFFAILFELPRDFELIKQLKECANSPSRNEAEWMPNVREKKECMNDEG